MDFTKGGRFYVVDDKKKAEVPEIHGKLNPKVKDEDEVFNGSKDDNMSGLPF